MTDQSRSADRKFFVTVPVPAVFVFQIIALAIAGWINRQALNPDGVAYMRIASYYAAGRMDLAITGYWGPLLSWLLVPWLKAGATAGGSAPSVLAPSAVSFFFAG